MELMFYLKAGGFLGHANVRTFQGPWEHSAVHRQSLKARRLSAPLSQAHKAHLIV